MSEYHSRTFDTRSARQLSSRGQRSHRFWLALWSLVAAALVFTCVALAHDAATVILSGFLTHPHS